MAELCMKVSSWVVDIFVILCDAGIFKSINLFINNLQGEVRSPRGAGLAGV